MLSKVTYTARIRKTGDGRSPMKGIRVLLMALSLCFAATGLHGEENKLSLHDCIETALRNQPTIRAARETVHAGEGREMQASSPYLPQVAASTGYSENRSFGGAFGDSMTKAYVTTLSVDQLLYDFGKTGNAHDAARSGTLALVQDAERAEQETVLNVKQSYYALLASQKLLEAAARTVEQTERHLREAEAFFRAGSKPRFDVTRAEVEVNNANLGLLNARNDVRLRTIELNNVMGVDPGRPARIVDDLPPVPALPTLDQAQAAALRDRPELKKMDADIDAARARVRAEEANYLPTLKASAAYNWQNGTAEMGSFKGDLGNSWNAGVMLTVPLFQGGVTRGRVSEARADLLALEARREALKQTVLLEVSHACADIESAASRVEVMERTVQKVRENLEIAQGRYEAGVGPSLEVTDAQLSAVNAETDHIRAVYDQRLAIARLLKAVGSKNYE